MYLEFYHMDSAPFENTPDHRFYFASETHREALAAIEYTIRMRKGFVLISGLPGTGKTTITRTLTHRCGEKTTIVQIVPGFTSGTGLIRQALKHLGNATDRDADYDELLEGLREAATGYLERGRPLVLVVDEAQSLSDEALESLRLLSNLDTGTQKPIQIVLVGQPRLFERLRGREHTALRQRIAMAKRVDALRLEETDDYITHRLRCASPPDQEPLACFSPGAVREIHRISGGVPRVINLLCDNALLMGFVQETPQITPEMIHRVVDDMIPGFFNPGTISEPPSAQLSLAGSM